MIDFTDGTWVRNYSNVNKRWQVCGCEITFMAPPINGWVWTHRCDEHKETMHRHHSFVDHQKADHGHGACSDHAHWAVGTHATGTDLEVSTPENDPLGHLV